MDSLSLEHDNLAHDAPSFAGPPLYGVASRGLPICGHEAFAIPHATATVDRNTSTWTVDFRAFAQHVDTVIKANSTTQVIYSAEAIAAEVLKQQQHHMTLQRGICVFREL